MFSSAVISLLLTIAAGTAGTAGNVFGEEPTSSKNRKSSKSHSPTSQPTYRPFPTAPLPTAPLPPPSTFPSQFDRKNVLVVVDMENSYCSAEVCPDYDPTVDDGPEFGFTPSSWVGPGCDAPCSTNEDCYTAAKNQLKGFLDRPHQVVDTWEETVRQRQCVNSKCFCDSVPGEATVINNIVKIIKAKKKGTSESVWDAILFTHDWNAYNIGTPDNFHPTSLVAWTKGSEIVKQLSDAVDEALGTTNGIINSPKVIHYVKQHANWGFARHQDMVERFLPQGQYLPLHLRESVFTNGTSDFFFDPSQIQLTVAGSFTQYCVLSGVLQTMLGGFDKMWIPEPSTGGYDDSQAFPLAGSPQCPNGTLLDTNNDTWYFKVRDDPTKRGGTISCPRPIPPPGSKVADFTSWMSDTAGGEGDNTHTLPAYAAELPFSAETVQTTKKIALEWMSTLGADVFPTWNEYVNTMDGLGIEVSQ